jgi:hypothetical protein
VVEGSGTALFDNAEHNCLYIREDLGGRNAEGPDTCLIEPLVAIRVLLRAVSPFVDLTVHLHSQSCRLAVEVEHIRTRRMLAAKLESTGPGSQHAP